MENKNLIFEKINELKKHLKKWNKEYYENDASTIDDSIYDQTLKELFELEKANPEFITLDSPTQIVGGKTSSSFKKIKHEISMLSLKNAFNEGDLRHFDKQIKEIFDNYDYYVEPKIDGLSISLIYKNGKLDSAITRGDGEIGEDVTINVLQIKSVPNEILNKNKIEFRGEIYISKKNFIELNKNRKENDELLFSNPRNAASGTLRQLNPEIVKERNLDIKLYWAYNHDEKNYLFKTQEKTINSLKKLGFPIAEISQKVNNIDEVIKLISEYSIFRKKVDYEIDGIVIKINDLNLHKGIGYTSKFPKWAIAYKFPAKIKETLLLNIFPTVGRTGRITYNALLKPIKIAGTIVQRATLHNADYIKDLDLRIGDYVLIKKAGEIIPKIISSNKSKRKIELDIWKEFKNCPSCNSDLIRFENEVDQYCSNLNCPGRILEKMIHFTSKNAMNIEGISEKQLEKFINLGWIKDFSDIYKLKEKKEEILNLDGYQNKSVNKLLSSIEKTKLNSLDRLLFGLGIRYIGKKTSKDLAKNFKNLQNIINTKIDEFINHNDLGEVKSKSIINYFNDKNNIFILNKLILIGINPIYEDKFINKNNPFYNKKVVITGKINGTTREEIKDIFGRLGAKVMSSISNETELLICGDNPSKNKINKISNEKVIIINDIKDFEKYEI